jgi:hypothetical protein
MLISRLDPALVRPSGIQFKTDDPETGTLKVITSGTPEATLNGLGGPGRSRQDRFTLMPDGKMGSFQRRLQEPPALRRAGRPR